MDRIASIEILKERVPWFGKTLGKWEIELEDKELTERFGEEHKHHIKETPTIFLHLTKLEKFLKLILKGGEI